MSIMPKKHQRQLSPKVFKDFDLVCSSRTFFQQNLKKKTTIYGQTTAVLWRARVEPQSWWRPLPSILEKHSLQTINPFK